MSSVVPFRAPAPAAARPWARLVQKSWAPAPHQMRDVLAANWGRFCLAAFPDDPHGCAAFFGVSRQCADNWMAGDVCRPSGHHVLAAVIHFGDGLAEMLAGVDALRVAA